MKDELEVFALVPPSDCNPASMLVSWFIDFKHKSVVA